MKDFFLVLIGGLCSAIGGCIAIWYQVKKARQIRMEEVRGEQGLEACKKALSLISQIGKLPVQADEELNFLLDNDEWFSMNQMLLPHTFVENWRSIKVELKRLKRTKESLDKLPDGPKRDEKVEDFISIGDFINRLAEEAEEAIRTELKLPQVKLKLWKKPNES